MKGVFLGNWKDTEGVSADFDERDLKGVEILFAWYEYKNYNGNAFVIFAKDGKLYEVNGGHCSCRGLEGQWDPEETSTMALRHRIVEGSLGSGDGYDGADFKEPLVKVLDEYEKR